jgi:hypothetical protein
MSLRFMSIKYSSGSCESYDFSSLSARNTATVNSRTHTIKDDDIPPILTQHRDDCSKGNAAISSHG